MVRSQKKPSRSKTDKPSGPLESVKIIPASGQSKKRIISRFGLTESKVWRAAKRLKEWQVENWVSHAPLFCVMRKMLGSFRGKEILEIGSQTADFASVLKNLGAKVSVMDKKGVKSRTGIEGKQGYFEDLILLFFNKKFDAVVSNWSFGEFSADKLLALAGICNILKPGGYLIISTLRAPNITKQDLERVGLKVQLDAKNLRTNYGLKMQADSSILIAQKPIQKVKK